MRATPTRRSQLTKTSAATWRSGSAGARRIAADLAEAAVATITDAEAVGRFDPLPESDLFDVEYWSLEQAKLGGASEPPLAGQVAVITGAAGAIGFATAKAFAVAGAAVALLDIDEAAARAKASAIGGAAIGVRCDVTDAASVREAFAQVVSVFGGIDILVSNAGAAWQGRIGEVDEAVLRRSFELNFYGHQRVAQAAVKTMQAQGTGGCLLFNVSKQAVNPGPGFGPYGLPKAATAVSGAAIRGRLWQRVHPRQRRQCRPHPLRASDRGHDRLTLQRPRRQRAGLHARQPAWPGSGT
jgi:NADP-dependent 3-hydroxy acid dehydrogenase YdfG